MTAGTLRILLLVLIFVLYAMAIFYLSRRPLSRLQFALWGFFALFVPILGPFIIFLAQPSRRSPR